MDFLKPPFVSATDSRLQIYRPFNSNLMTHKAHLYWSQWCCNCTQQLNSHYQFGYIPPESPLKKKEPSLVAAHRCSSGVEACRHERLIHQSTPRGENPTAAAEQPVVLVREKASKSKEGHPKKANANAHKQTRSWWRSVRGNSWLRLDSAWCSFSVPQLPHLGIWFVHFLFFFLYFAHKIGKYKTK